MQKNNGNIKLIPSKNGDECPANGKTLDSDGNIIECCCDECDYYLGCFSHF